MITKYQAISLLEEVIGQEITDIHCIIFSESWDGKTYKEIASKHEYAPSYVSKAGSELWDMLSEATGTRISKANLCSALTNYQQNVVKSPYSFFPSKNKKTLGEPSIPFAYQVQWV